MFSLGGLANIGGLAVIEIGQNGAETRGLELGSTLLHLVVDAPPAINNRFKEVIRSDERTQRSRREKRGGDWRGVGHDFAPAYHS